ncbi:MAG: redoxin domain-containing protein, partial [Cyanobacteria bacterium P01_A01_bin.17]
MTLQLGDVVPNFTQQNTEGEINFYDWAGSNWVVLFSHPADYTPVRNPALVRLNAIDAEGNHFGPTLGKL